MLYFLVNAEGAFKKPGRSCKSYLFSGGDCRGNKKPQHRAGGSAVRNCAVPRGNSSPNLCDASVYFNLRSQCPQTAESGGHILGEGYIFDFARSLRQRSAY